MGIIKSKKFKVIIIVIILAIIGSFALNKYFEYRRPLILKKSQIVLFIRTTDEVCNGKCQLNWQQVAAIECAKYNNETSKINKDSIKKIANQFITQKNVQGKIIYGSRDFIDVLDEYKLPYLQNKKALHNLEILKPVSLVEEDKSQKNFIKDLEPAAIDIYNKYHILPSVLLSQAILESNWGKSQLTIKANNVFGIKADIHWKGKKVKMETKEDYNKKIKDEFRKYDSKAQSIEDYGCFLNSNERYKKHGVFNAKTYQGQAKAIENAGYSTATDENGNLIYAKLLESLIKEHNLQLIDYKVEKKQFDLLN